MEEERNFPTMIIPNGTRIEVNDHGQLSIRTPGNLVIQNSGSYSVVESGNGSIRIDPGVKVEAVSIQAADACYIAGTLTAWRVKAQKILLEKGAQAYIMLQESEGLELDRSARLVGNFATERELYLMLGRFTRQLRDLPDMLEPSEESPRLNQGQASALRDTVLGEDEPFVSPDGEDEPGDRQRQQREEMLSLVRVVLERQLGSGEIEGEARGAVERLVELARTRDMERLRESYGYLFSQIPAPSQELQSVRSLLDRLFQNA